MSHRVLGPQFMENPQSYQDADGYRYDVTPGEHNWADGNNNLSLWAPGSDGLEPAGQMTWHPQEGHVTWIEVPEGMRRQGHATRMWNMAKEVSSKFDNIVEPKHSPSQTPSGERWAWSVN